MEPNAILCADPLDLLFDNRNKEYGAYPLRKFYDRRLVTGLLLSLSAGVILFSLLTGEPAATVVVKDYNIPDLVFDQPIVPLARKPKPVILPQKTVHVATVANTVLRIVPDPQADKPIHAVEDLLNARIGSSDLAGPPEAAMAPAATVGSPGNVIPTPAKEAATEIYRTADRMPQFPGGQEALMRFLTRNLRMPEGAEAGTKVSVLATFVVGADGRVTQAAMGKSGGVRFDAEVKRVLSEMPAWIPGKIGNRAVAVYFNLPVQFVVPEE